jgi:hypothetical protein
MVKPARVNGACSCCLIQIEHITHLAFLFSPHVLHFGHFSFIFANGPVPFATDYT